MPRGPKKHLKRLNAPKHWMLGKLGGIFVSGTACSGRAAIIVAMAAAAAGERRRRLF